MTHQVASGDTLTVFRNEDTALERPFLIAVPSSVDTLAELCQYLTAKIPSRGAESETPRGYRFLYSVRGKPLWRVKECIEASAVVVSVGPGFQARQPQALADAALEEIVARAQRTPPGASSLTFSSITDTPSGASASPPVRQPVSQTNHNGTAVYDPTEASPPPKPHPNAATANATYTSSAPFTGDVLVGPSEEVAEPFSVFSLGEYPTTASSERAAQYRVSITRPSGTSAGAEPSAPLAGLPSGSADEARPAPRDPALSAERDGTERGPQQYAPRRTSIGEQQPQEVAEEIPAFAGKPSFTRSTDRNGSVASAHVDRASARGQFYVGSQVFALPPSPAFVSRAISDQLTEYVEDDTTFIGRLRLLLARKVVAAGEMKHRDAREVLGRERLAALQERIMDQLTPQGGRSVYRVVIEGPAGSGVSSSAALLADACLSDFAHHHQFFNHLLFPLDLSTVLGANARDGASGRGTPETNHNGPAAPPSVGIPLLYNVVVAALMDAVAVQRPALRPHSVLLFELWERLLSRRGDADAPDFLAFSQIATLVGFKVLSRWHALARRIFPLLKAACADPTSSHLRDAVLDVIFYAIPTEVAASLRFGGVLYVLDGLAHLCAARQPPSHAPRARPMHADLAAALKPLWDDAHCNVIVAWPASVPGDRVFLSHTTRRVQTIGLLTLTPQEAAAAGLPQRIVVAHRGQSYPLSVLLGAPGYVAQLLPLVRPRLLKTQLPTTAFSSAYQSVKKTQGEKPFVLHVDDEEVSAALAGLHQAARVM